MPADPSDERVGDRDCPSRGGPSFLARIEDLDRRIVESARNLDLLGEGISRALSGGEAETASELGMNLDRTIDQLGDLLRCRRSLADDGVRSGLEIPSEPVKSWSSLASRFRSWADSARLEMDKRPRTAGSSIRRSFPMVSGGALLNLQV